MSCISNLSDQRNDSVISKSKQSQFVSNVKKSIFEKAKKILNFQIMAKMEYFDLEYFLKSTDAGLYNIAKEIFSYLDPPDLVKIGKVTKKFSEFTKNEKDYLWNKFEKISMKIPKNSFWIKEVISKEGFELDFVQNVFNVSLKVFKKKKGPFTIVSLMGYPKSVDEASKYIELWIFWKGKDRKFGKFSKKACLKWAKGLDDSSGVFPEDFGFESLRLN